MIYINPWTWYILNDKIPSIYPISFKSILVIFVWFLMFLGWGFGMMWITENVIGFRNENFHALFMLTFFSSLGAFVTLTIWLLPKALRKFDKH